MSVLGVISSVVAKEFVTGLTINVFTFFQLEDNTGIVKAFHHAHLSIGCGSTHILTRGLTLEAIELADFGHIESEGEELIVIIVNIELNTGSGLLKATSIVNIICNFCILSNQICICN